MMHNYLFIFILFSLGWIAMKLSLPILPQLSMILHTTPWLMKLSISVFFVCYAASQFIWAALSEKYGRRPIILIGLCVAVLGTIVTIYSHDGWHYILGRCIEGVGIGIASPLGRAMISDCFEAKEIARMLAIVGCVNGLMPAFAPIIGGYIFTAFGWKSVYLLFLLLTTSYLIWAYYKLPETLNKVINTNSLLEEFKQYAVVSQDSYFWKYFFGYALTQATLVGYYGAMPFWYVDQWHLHENTYSFLALFSVISYVLTLLCTRKLLTYISMVKLYKFSLCFCLFTAMLGLSLSLLHQSGVIMLVIIMTLFSVTPGIAFPTANAILLRKYSNHPAKLSALSSTIMFLFAGLLTWLESQMTVGTLWEISMLILLVSVIGLGMLMEPMRHFKRA